MKLKLTSTLSALAVSLIALTAPAKADEVTLRAISAFQTGTAFAKPFDEFVQKVNEAGKGLVKIQVLGGPEAMPPFEVGNALRGNVIDLANTTAVFHANLVPEGVALTMTDLSMAELRQNGGYDLMNQIHEKRARIHWLGRLAEKIKYHVYLSKPAKSDSFDGLKLRSVPIYQAFFSALGANPMQIAPGEVFTALERGTIDGYGWPSIGVFDLGWQEQTKTRVDPGFYQVETGVYFSLAAWNKLNAEQKAVFEKAILAMEDSSSRFEQDADAERKRQGEAGIETYNLPEVSAAKFLQTAQEAGWAQVLKVSPQDGAALQKLFTK
jgi:TRAP-type C4-dicarboxylate transport system, periplasmic component